MGKFKPYGAQNTWSKFEQPESHDILINRLKSRESPLVIVPAREHANMDSLPFRFGMHFRSEGYLSISNITNIAPGKGDGFIEMDATFEILDFGGKAVDLNGDFLNEPYEKHTGHLVLLKKSRGSDFFKLVTVWRNDNEDEFYLSELMKRLRKAGHLTPEILIELHPRYLSGELSTMEALFSALVEKGSVPEMNGAKLDAIKSELREEYESEIKFVREIANQAVEGLKAEEARSREKDAENSQLKEQLGLVEAEFERYKKENSAANSRSEIATLSDEDLLIKVNFDVVHKGSSCTELVFGNEVKKYMKVSTFDPRLEISRKAKSLEGKRVKTTCWDPVNQPGKWSRQGYFRNVYEVQIK
ncbi:hypothetical protein N9P30_02315 [Alphaproteobacteria bacterium]|nr:hypothetical protein [Alphaproteobacteria bacterium]